MIIFPLLLPNGRDADQDVVNLPIQQPVAIALGPPRSVFWNHRGNRTARDTSHIATCEDCCYQLRHGITSLMKAYKRCHRRQVMYASIVPAPVWLQCSKLHGLRQQGAAESATCSTLLCLLQQRDCHELPIPAHVPFGREGDT